MTLGLVSFVLSLCGAVPYVYQIVRGTVRPERATWFAWSVILALAIASSKSSGAHDSLWFLVGDLVVTSTIFILSLWRGQGGFTRLDACCLGIAALGLVVWQWSGSPVFGLLGAAAADVAALVPTLVKSLRDPLSEGVSPYLCSSLAALLGFVAVGQWNGMLLFYPAYIFIASFTTAVVVWVGKYHRGHYQPTEAQE